MDYKIVKTTSKVVLRKRRIEKPSKTRVSLKCDLFRCDVMSEVVCVTRFI